MTWKDKFQQDKPWAVLGWTRKQWKRSRLWKRARVSEEKMVRPILSLDHETVLGFKDSTTTEVLVYNMFGTEEQLVTI